jgi:hypothetical protein
MLQFHRFPLAIRNLTCDSTRPETLDACSGLCVSLSSPLIVTLPFTEREIWSLVYSVHNELVLC